MHFENRAIFVIVFSSIKPMCVTARFINQEFDILS